MKKEVVFIVLFLLMFSSVVADSYVVANDNDGRGGDSLFNQGLTDTTVFSSTIDGGSSAPLYANLDNSSLTEIIAWDGARIQLFQNKTLDLLDNFLTNLSSESVKSTIITDLTDGARGRNIVITSDSSDGLFILNYSASGGLTSSVYQSIQSSGSNDGHRQIGCDNETGMCLVVGSARSMTGGADFFRYHFFNTTFRTQTPHNIQPATTDEIFCGPRIRNMQVVDIDRDGVKEYIFTYAILDASGNDIIKLAIMQPDLQNGTAKRVTVTTVNGGDAADLSSDTDCAEIGGDFTAPLVFDVDSGGDKEIIVGFEVSSNDFVMHTFDRNGAELDRYPNVLNSQGTIISNIFRMNAFPDSPDGSDFCVFGHDSVENVLELLCASEQRTGTSFFFFPALDNSDFDFDLTGFGGFVLPAETSKSYSAMAHSTQALQTLTDDVNLHEIVTTYGVFALASSETLKLDILKLINRFPRDNGTVIPIDIENTGFDDLLIYGTKNIFYVDDKFVNKGGKIFGYETDPCLEPTLAKGNVTTSPMSVTITAKDDDNDNVRARAILYQGRAFAQDSGFSVNVSTGSEISFSFVVNESVSNGVLRLIVTDVVNPSQEDVLDLPFSVASQGVRFGDCKTIRLIDPIDNETAEAIALFNAKQKPNIADNSIGSFIGELGDDSGLGTMVIWLLLLFIVTLGLIGSDFCKADAKMGVIAITVINGVGIIVGALLGFIPLGIIVTITVIGIGIAALVFRRSTAGS